MALSAPLADAEVETHAATLAAEILLHPLARRLDWQTVWVVRAVATEDPAIRPADAVPVLRLAMAAIDAAEIELGLGVP